MALGHEYGGQCKINIVALILSPLCFLYQYCNTTKSCFLACSSCFDYPPHCSDCLCLFITTSVNGLIQRAFISRIVAPIAVPYKQIGYITSFPMLCMIIIRQIRHVYNQYKILCGDKFSYCLSNIINCYNNT